jgi:cytochrome c oxidase subunit II
MKVFPLSYLDAAGRRAEAILPLTWLTLIISIVVCVVIGVLLWLAVRRARPADAGVPLRDIPLQRPGRGMRWIGMGVAISAVPLAVTLVWTMVVLAAVSSPPKQPAVVLDVTAHQWWWEVQYDSDKPSETFATANEIHIPVGVAVLVRLHGGDVIHSFWVPKLSGKTDAIPGQTNITWLQANQPGRYRGQCTEFCGYQHAHMAFEVVAEPQEDFDRWLALQRAAAPEPSTPQQQRGLALVEYRCGLCHRVRGTDAGAISAPDLTHLMSRQMIAAGTLPNDAGNLMGWIQDPQSTKPESLMPNQFLSAQQLSDAVAYLEQLK